MHGGVEDLRLPLSSRLDSSAGTACFPHPTFRNLRVRERISTQNRPGNRLNRCNPTL